MSPGCSRYTRALSVCVLAEKEGKLKESSRQDENHVANAANNCKGIPQTGFSQVVNEAMTINEMRLNRSGPNFDLHFTQPKKKKKRLMLTTGIDLTLAQLPHEFLHNYRGSKTLCVWK